MTLCSQHQGPSQVLTSSILATERRAETGDIVKVMEVDVARKRIGLSMKLGDAPPRQGGDRGGPRDNRFEGAGRGQRQAPSAPQATAMASAFSKLQGLRK